MIEKRDGVYPKFIVRRADARDLPGQKHHGCRYFVLDLDHDRHAAPALLAYAESCEGELPCLASDLRRIAMDTDVGRELVLSAIGGGDE